MYAQVTTITWPSGEKVEGMDEAIQSVRDQLVPFTELLQGFKGFLGLSRNGEIILMSLWETEADLQATKANHYAEYLKDKLGIPSHPHTTPLWLQDYKVFTLKLS